MKVIYFLMSLLCAFFCGVNINAHDWLWAIIYCVFAFTSMTWFIEERYEEKHRDDN